MKKRKKTIAPLEPYSDIEAEKIRKRIDSFYDKLRKDFGEQRYDLYTSTIISITSTKQLITILRGNMLAAQSSIASSIALVVDEAHKVMKLPKEQLLLFSVTDLAAEVRKIWSESHGTSNIRL